ncbi:MAG: S-layer homology domain-containing protein [Oscillospiraceae bacterium]|nr:S-layer homology domain-containing protein [Oscillospiraceae bacterium]
MRNLKKSLALLLALVMVLGLCAINAGAVFGDEDAIDENYAPAVDVMTGMGILKGDDNDGDGVNEFRPEDPVTRAEAAKMITYMMLGEDTAEMLPARAVLDVPETHWASGYINFLYNKGIIDGMGDGTFAASASVTALQYAKMLLCACGYGTKKEYVGTGWDVNVFIDAIDADKGNIFGDADVADFATPATRQEAAYYTFNALTKTEIVTYSDGKYKGTSKYYSGKYGYETVEGVVLASADTTSNATAKLAYTDSEKKPAELKFKDGLDKELIGHQVKVVYDTASKKDGVYTAIYSVEDLSTEVPVNVTVKELIKALGGNSYKYSADYIYWENYVKKDTTTNQIDWTKESQSKDASSLTADKSLEGVYILDKDGDIIGYKNVSFTVGTVTKITNSVGAEKISLNISGIGVKVYENNDDTDVIVEYPGIAKGDRVQITQIGDIIYLYKCDVVRVNVTRYSPMKGIINNEYEKDLGNSSGDYGDAVKTKQAYDLYLGENGKWIYAKNMGDIVGDYFLLTRTYTKDEVNYAEGVDGKGEIVTYRLKDADAKAAVDAINKPIDDLDHTGFAPAGPLVTPDKNDPARVYPKFDWGSGTKESVNRRAVCYVGAPKTGDDGEEYYDVKSYDEGFGTCPGSGTAIGSSPSYPIELSKFGVVRNAWGDTIPSDSIYRITADTKYYFVGYDSAKKKTIVSPATGADSSQSYPVTFVATKVANSNKYFDVEVLFFNRDSKVASGNLTDDFTKTTYSSGDPIFSVGLGVVKDTSKAEDAMGNPQGAVVGTTINKDYWSYVLDKDDSDTPEYWYLSGAFINGEWENEVMLKFDESNEGAKDWFATETVGSTEYEYLKPGFYTYAYDEEDESYRLGYSAKGGLYVQAFAESSKKGSGYTTFLQNVKLLDRFGDGFIFDIDTHTTTTSYWTTTTVPGRYDGMYDNNTSKGYIETIRTLVNPDNYDDNIVDLVNPYGKEIMTVDEIVDLMDEGYTIYVSLAYWCAGPRLLSPLFITAIVPPAAP